MKNFLTILLLIFSITFSAAYASEDIDGDGINDDIDTQNTYYNVISSDLHKYFLYDFSKDVSKTSDSTTINNIKALSKDNTLVYLD
jgi:predicted class III extradiol MEMO1 family dioxygenase